MSINFIFGLIVLVSLVLTSDHIALSAGECSVSAEVHGKLENGDEIKLYTLKDSNGSFVKISEFGATITEIQVPDKSGTLANVILGPGSLEVLVQGFPAASLIGRYANRIKGAEVSINGKSYPLRQNMGTGDHIHGGKQNFSKRKWQHVESVTTADKSSLVLKYVSKDLEEGFPGELTVTVTYSFENESLSMETKAVTTKDTVLNLTNHAYFNLTGDPTKTILDHQVKINAEEYVEADGKGFPTGKILKVANTPFEFQHAKKFGTDIEKLKPIPGGYDHCYVVAGKAGELNLAAIVVDKASGRTLICSTTEPGLQLYTANKFSGKPFPAHAAFCLETQHYPDSPHFSHFPSTLLLAGEAYKSKTVYSFALEKD
jgi:aldose 1-epimerase